MTAVRRINAARANVSVARTQRGRLAAAWTVVVISGALQVAARRFYVNPDGVSYLNLSDAYTRGDWAGAVNTYWSPLYPFIIGATRRVFPWPMYWESSITHLINLAIYLGSYACFRMMLREVTAYQREKQAAEAECTSYSSTTARRWSSRATRPPAVDQAGSDSGPQPFTAYPSRRSRASAIAVSVSAGVRRGAFGGGT